MGKLRFALTYVLFWLIIVLSCLLAENFAFITTADHVRGMSIDSALILSLATIALLVCFYFSEHKKNGLKFDKVLLPILSIFTLISICTIWWQGSRIFINLDDGYKTSINIDAIEKISYSLQFLVWAGFIYALSFVVNRFSISRKWTRWIAAIFVFGMLAATVADIIMEHQSIKEIFTSTYTGHGLQFIIYNENVWGHLILVAMLSCIVLNVKKFHIFYYIAMVYFFVVMLFTTCATAIFVGVVAIALYTLYEILSRIKQKPLKMSILLAVYLVTIGAICGTIAICVKKEVPAFVNFWSFISGQILNKDYTTLTSRTGIWASVLRLVSQHPQDMIFGLGYRTGNLIFTQYFLATNNHDFAVNSTHNAFFEILLRHGIIGVCLYISMLFVFAIGVIKLFKKKQYRVACLYALCVCGLLAHSGAESTIFFSANTSSVYTTLIFFLPIVNAVQSKHFEELNSDLQQYEIEKIKPIKKDVVYFSQLMVFGLMIVCAFSLIFVNIRETTPVFIVYLVIIGVLVALYLLAPLFVTIFGKEKFTKLQGLQQFVFAPLKDNYIGIIAVGVFVFLCAFISPELYEFNILTAMLFTVLAFAIYFFVVTNLAKPENNVVKSYFNSLLLEKLKNISTEADNG